MNVSEYTRLIKLTDALQTRLTMLTDALHAELEDVASKESCVDVDGNKYKTVKIGDQTLMEGNLKVTHYRNGDPIPYISCAEDWKRLGVGAQCIYNNNTSNLASYGRLYNWYAVNDPRGLAPEGWHIPTDAEWNELEKYVGVYTGSKLAGKPELWDFGNLRKNDAFGESGFTVLPGGYRYSYDGGFGDMGGGAYFWSASGSDVDRAWYHLLVHFRSDICRDNINKKNGFSIRCIKDK